MITTNFNDIKDVLVEATKDPDYEEVGIGSNHSVRVLKYLPIDGKANLIQYVVNRAIDGNTGYFSPVRVNVYYAIGVMRAYCGVHFDEDQNISEAYDLLENTGILDRVLNAIPEDEREYMEKLLDDTIQDIEKYNSSFAGMISAMSGEATGLDNSLQSILEKIKNKEGLEILSEIKNAVGTD